MIPKPTSEAWVLCALKDNPYQDCAVLEDRSARDHSAHPLKRELQGRLGDSPSADDLCRMVRDRTIDINRIDMPSFQAFRVRLEEVI